MIDMTPKELCLILDHAARADLRQAVSSGYINRSHHKKRGVKLLELLGLVERTKTLKTMYRYEPTALGLAASEYLPSPEAEWTHVMGQAELVYSDGTIILHGDVPRYSTTRDYDKFVWKLRTSKG